jgi:hypothetical protein
MAKKYRLLIRAQMHGAIRDPGYIFELAEGELGPHRTVLASNKGAQLADHDHPDRKNDLIDVPQYEEMPE